MSLSGYDSEVVGFESVTQNKRPETTVSVQTTEFSETGMASQTNLSKDSGCVVTPEALGAEDDVLKEYPPPGLNEFLRKVVPAMMEQLNQTDKDFTNDSSDFDEDEVICAKLFQEIKVPAESPVSGAGDQQSSSILGVSWSSAGNSLAVSIGVSQHENWCEHDGLIKVYTLKHNDGDRFVPSFDISEKNCVAVLKYHPSVAALLAYGTTSGEVVICNLRYSSDFEDGQLTSPSGCHGSKRVSALHWADASLANIFLTLQINRNGKRRVASDQILVSAGCDGTMNVWQVNADSRTFQNIICYHINGSRKMAALDITCFDFIKCYPLRPSDEKLPGDIFVVGTKAGGLYLCKSETYHDIVDSTGVDPVYEALEGHSTCVLDVAFSFQKPGIFASISMGSELKVYDINQLSPLKVLCLDMPISCMTWLPNNPCIVILGLAKIDKDDSLMLYNVSSGRRVPVDGLKGDGASVTAVAVHQSGACRVAAGDSAGVLRVWDLPSRRIRLTMEDLEF